jgi:hypothetical protein
MTTVTFDREEFLLFLQWVGVDTELETTTHGSETFRMAGSMGNTFDLDVISP